MDPRKGLGQLFGFRDIINAVQTADAGVDSAVEVQMFHGLAQENGCDRGNAAILLRCLRQHFRRLVHADHLVSPQGQFTGEGAGAAG